MSVTLKDMGRISLFVLFSWEFNFKKFKIKDKLQRTQRKFRRQRPTGIYVNNVLKPLTVREWGVRNLKSDTQETHGGRYPMTAAPGRRRDGIVSCTNRKKKHRELMLQFNIRKAFQNSKLCEKAGWCTLAEVSSSSLNVFEEVQNKALVPMSKIILKNYPSSETVSQVPSIHGLSYV